MNTIDANIPGQAVGEPFDPLAAYGKMAQIQSMKQQAQIGAQKIVMGDMEIKQAKRAEQYQKDFTQAVQENTVQNPDGSIATDWGKVGGSLTRNGHGMEAMKLDETVLAGKEKALDYLHKKNAAELDDVQFVGRTLGAIPTVDEKAPPEVQEQQKAAAAAAAVAGLSGLVKAGHMKPQDAAPIVAQIQQNGWTAPLAALAKQKQMEAATAEQQLQHLQFGITAARENRLADANIPHIEAETKKVNAEAGDAAAQSLARQAATARSAAQYQQILAKDPEASKQLPAVESLDWSNPVAAQQQILKAGMKPEQIAQNQLRQTEIANTAAHQKIEEQQGSQRIGLEAKRVGLEGVNVSLRQKEFDEKYGDALEGISPNNLAIAKQVADGDISIARLTRLRGKEQIMVAAGAIAAKDGHQLSEATFDTKQAFTDPNKKQSQNLGTISRIVGHIARFEKNSKAMGIAPAYASGVNITGGQNALNSDAHAIAAEAEKLFAGGVGTEGQVKDWQKSLHSPLPGARQQAIDEISQLIGSQYEGMNQTYKAGLGKELPVDKFVSKAGQAWMKSKGINVVGAADNVRSAASRVQQQVPQGKAAPTVGTIEDGHTFLGGDPADPKRWKKN